MPSVTDPELTAPAADPYWPATARTKGWPVWQIAYLAAVAGAYVEISESGARIRRYDGRVERVPRDSRTYSAKAQDAALNFVSIEAKAQAFLVQHAREIEEGRRPRRIAGDLAPPADYGICEGCRAPRLIAYASRRCNGCERWMNAGPSDEEQSGAAVAETPSEPSPEAPEATEVPVQAVAVDPEHHATSEVALPAEPWVDEALAHQYPRPLIAALAMAPGVKLVTASVLLTLCEGGGAFVVSPTTRVELLHFSRLSATAAVSSEATDEAPCATPDWYTQGLSLGWIARQLDSIRSLSSGRSGAPMTVTIGPDALEMTVGGEVTRVARYVPRSTPAVAAPAVAAPAVAAPAKLLQASQPPQPVVRRVIESAAPVVAAPVVAAPVVAAPVVAAPVVAAPTENWMTRALELGWPPARVAQLAAYWPPAHPMEVQVDRMLCPCGPGAESKFVFTHTGTAPSILAGRYARSTTARPERGSRAIEAPMSTADEPASTTAASASEEPAPMPREPPATRADRQESPVLHCAPCGREGLRRDACRLHPETGEGVCEDWEQIHPHGETLGDLIGARKAPAAEVAPDPTGVAATEAAEAPADVNATETMDDAVPWDPPSDSTEEPVAAPVAEAAATDQPPTPKLRRGEWRPPLDLVDPVTKEPWIYLQAWTDASASYGQRGSAPEPAGIGVVFVLEGKEHRAISQRIEDGDTYFAELRAIEIAIRQCPDDEPLYVIGDNESSLRVSSGEARPSVYEKVVARIRKMVEIRLRRGAPTYFRHVKGHVRHYFNHRADYLAHDAVKEFRKGTVHDPALETPPKPKAPPVVRTPKVPKTAKTAKTVAAPAESPEVAPAVVPQGPSAEEIAAATDARVIPSFLPKSERRQPRLGLW